MKLTSLLLISFFILKSSNTFSQNRYNRVVCGAFNSYYVEAEKSHIELKDGKKIYGDKIVINNLVFKKWAKVDDQEVKYKDIKGFARDGRYYLIHDSKHLVKLISGKLSVYMEEVNTSDRDFRYTYCYYYVNKSGSTDLQRLYEHQDLLNAVAGCKLSIKLLSFPTKELQMKIKEDPSYLNRVFRIFNNGCVEKEN
jgi:hypothetical protein